MNYYNDTEKEQIYRREITQRRQPKKTNRRKWQGHTQNMYWGKIFTSCHVPYYSTFLFIPLHRSH